MVINASRQVSDTVVGTTQPRQTLPQAQQASHHSKPPAASCRETQEVPIAGPHTTRGGVDGSEDSSAQTRTGGKVHDSVRTGGSDGGQAGSHQSREPAAAQPQQGENQPFSSPAASLWDDAYNILKTKQPKVIDAYEKDLLASGDSKTGDVPVAEGKPGEFELFKEERLKQLARRNLEDVTNSRWKITVRGHEYVVGEEFSKAIKTILSAKDIISSIASLEPHASMAWSGVMVLLQVSSLPALNNRF
jgi:N-terminal domain of NWD NACHT-NTPase